MSIFKLINKTGVDSSALSWANNKVFPNDLPVDLIDQSDGVGLGLDEILGIHAGSEFEDIAALIRTGEWFICDGDTTFNKEHSLELIKYGSINSTNIKTKVDMSQSGVAFESHNLGDSIDWTVPNMNSMYTIAPTTGKQLHLTGTKIMIQPDFDVKSDMYFRVYMDYEVSPGVIQNIMVREDIYTGTDKLMLGSTHVYTSPQVGNPTEMGRGSKEYVHIVYKYANPITLKSSINMRLEIGIVDDVVCPQATMMKVRVVGVSEVE